MPGKKSESGKRVPRLSDKERASCSANGTGAQHTHCDDANGVKNVQAHAGVEGQNDDGKSDTDKRSTTVEASTSFGSQQEGDRDTIEHQAEHQDGDLDSKNADVEKAGAQFENERRDPRA